MRRRAGGRMGRRMRGARDAWGTMGMGAVGGGYKKGDWWKSPVCMEM